MEPQPGRFHLLTVDISHVGFVAYGPATGNQHVTTCPPGREFIRRAASDTSLADPEPVSDLIDTS